MPYDAVVLETLRRARRDLGVLLVAVRHPRTPWYAKAWLLFVVAYAISPLDLIPDPIPVIGLLDDAILLPLGIVIAMRLIPDDVLAECRAAPPSDASRGLRIAGAVLVVALWIALLVGAALLLRRVHWHR
jgi:uncharacterized membrane protein YkvA (DUF1232 family)